jgi:hypothetical protein
MGHTAVHVGRALFAFWGLGHSTFVPSVTDVVRQRMGRDKLEDIMDRDDLTPMYFDPARFRDLRDDGRYLTPGWYAVDDGGRDRLGPFTLSNLCTQAIERQRVKNSN